MLPGEALSLLGCAAIVAVTLGGGVGGWFLWGWWSAIGGALLACLIALMICGFAHSPGPDEKR